MAINSFKGINSVLDVVDTIASVESTTVYPRGVLIINSSGALRLGDGTTAGGTSVGTESSVAFADVTGKPTTLAGYGITDGLANPSPNDLIIADGKGFGSSAANAGKLIPTAGAGYYGPSTQDLVLGSAHGIGVFLDPGNDDSGSAFTIWSNINPYVGTPGEDNYKLKLNGDTGNLGIAGRVTARGGFRGDLQGSVVADDSTVIIDGVAGTVAAGALTGALPALDGSALTGITGGGGLGNLVEDTTPELGGDLDTNGKDILLLNNRVKYNAAGGSMLDFTVDQYSVPNNTVLSSVGSINLFLDSASADVSGDTAFRIFDTTDPDGTVTEANNIFKVADTGDVSIKGKLKFPDGSVSANYAGFGAADDLKIFHNGNHSIVRETGTGNLYLQSNDNVILSKDSDTEIMIKAVADGTVELYHNAVKKFETTATGVQAVDEVHIEGATPYLTIRRTDNANIPLIRFQGSAGANGATIGMDGTSGTVNDLIISAYGGGERLRAETSGGIKVTGGFTLATAGTAPTSNGDAGATGEIRYDDNYIYIKTATGWKRANLSGIV